MSEVERQVAALSGQCHSHDTKLGELSALLQKLQARVDRADGSNEGVSPPVRSVMGAASQGGWHWWAVGLPGDATLEFSGVVFSFWGQGIGGPCSERWLHGWQCGFLACSGGELR